VSKWCGWGGEVFLWRQKAGSTGWPGVNDAASHAGAIVVCPGCGRELKARGALRNEGSYGMVPRHLKPVTASLPAAS